MLKDVAVWEERVDTQDPLGIVFWNTQPDITRELLLRGLAKLEDETNAPLEYQEAQIDAKGAGRGQWDSERGKTQEPNPSAETNTSTPLMDTLKNAATWWGGGSATAITLYGIWKFFIGLSRRRRVPLLFLGASSAGKTWLWARIRDADITSDELKRIDKTDVTMREVASRPLPMGRYEIKPLYIDTPGGQPSWQAAELTRKRRFWGQKSVWILLLSTTRKAVTRDSSEEEKIDRDYINEQLGYLHLPLGLLGAPRVQRPKLIVIAVSKFDIFSSQDPSRDASKEAKEKLQELFSPHIRRINGECNNVSVECKVEFCSALEGWNTEVVNRHISKVLFPG
ncbi:MAG TPA: hypothetical protein VF789_12570 [Thermoanaerobaculia bacterium]